MNKQLILTFVAGVLCSAAAIQLFTSSKANSQAETLSGLIQAGRCQVQVDAPTLQSGYQCGFNRVMTGHLNGNMYCSNISVVCN